jgi:hypothetical protein
MTKHEGTCTYTDACSNAKALYEELTLHLWGRLITFPLTKERGQTEKMKRERGEERERMREREREREKREREPRERERER